MEKNVQNLLCGIRVRLVAVLSVLSVVVQSASAFGGFEENGFIYNVNNDGTSVTLMMRRNVYNYPQPYSDLSGELVLPATVTHDGKEYTLTAIEEGSTFGGSGITSIRLPETIHVINSNNFANCAELTSVEIPQSVYMIGPRAFLGCKNLSDIKLHAGVTYVGTRLLRGRRGIMPSPTVRCILMVGHLFTKVRCRRMPTSRSRPGRLESQTSIFCIR